MSFKKASEVFIKDKDTVGIRLNQQKCPMGRRKVFEGKVYIAKGKVEDLLTLVKHELPVMDK